MKLFPCTLYKQEGRIYIKNNKRLVYDMSWKCKEDFGDYLEDLYHEKTSSRVRDEIYINLKEVVADFCRQNLEYDLLLEESFRLMSSGDVIDAVVVKELSRNAWFDKKGNVQITNSSIGL